MKFRLLAATALVAFAAPLAFASAEHGVDLTAMDKTAVPGDDWFNYADGGWVAKNQIPGDQPSWGMFQVLRELSSKRTAGLIQDTAKETNAPGSEKAKIADFYASFMDEATIEKKGLSPLKPELAAIDSIKDKKALAHALGAVMRSDVDALNNTNFYTENLFGIWVAPGFSDSAHYTGYLMQGGLGIPSRDYYLGDNPKYAAIREAYQAYIAKMLTLAGYKDADAKAEAIFGLEMKIASAQESIVESQDVVKANNPWSRADFSAKAPGLDWTAFFAGAGLNKPKGFIVWQPAAFTQLSALVQSEPLDTWKAYLAFHRINHSAPELPKAFVDTRFNFYGKTLSGTPQLRDRWKRGVDATNAALGDAIGKIYAAKYFSPRAKAKAQEMVKNIVDAWYKRIDALAWMTPATKAKAKEKLSVLYVGIGYPETWRDYSKLTVVKGDALGNQERSELFDYRHAVDRIGGKADDHEWSMTPQTVNAVNLPLQNALNFPAAILEKPFFDADAADAFNYGAIGSVIGHEISHSFDDQGAAFDKTGRLFDWWTKEDFAHFKASGDALAAQYSTYKPFPDLAINGEQTLGENIADVAGLASSYDGWKASLGGHPAPEDQGLTGDQQFFLANAQLRANRTRDAAMRQQVLTDVHSPSTYRALAVRNLAAWYAAFDVKPGQKLYLDPKDRVLVW